MLHCNSLKPRHHNVGAGLFVEDNTGSPLNITADAISIVGSDIGATFITTATPTQNLLNITTAYVNLNQLSFQANPFLPPSTAAAIVLTADVYGNARFQSVAVVGFQTGIALNSTTGVPIILFDNVQCAGNTTCIAVNNSTLSAEHCVFQGPYGTVTPGNTGIRITGSLAQVAVLSAIFRLFDTCINVSNGAIASIISSAIESSNNSVVCSDGSTTQILGIDFVFNLPGCVNVAASDSGTIVKIVGSHFQGGLNPLVPLGTAVKVTNAATILLHASLIENVDLGIAVGDADDIDTTLLRASNVSLVSSTTHIQQKNLSTFSFVGSSFDKNKTFIENPTNVNIAAFDRDATTGQVTLGFGNTQDTSQKVYEILNGQSAVPYLSYEPNYYGYKGTIYKNPNADPTFCGVQAQSNDARYVCQSPATTPKKQASTLFPIQTARQRRQCARLGDYQTGHQQMPI